MTAPIVSIVQRNVFQVRLGDKTVALEGGFVKSTYIFRIDELREWRYDNGEVVNMTNEDKRLVIETVQNYFRGNWARRLFREKCVFIKENEEIEIPESLGVRALKYLKGKK